MNNSTLFETFRTCETERAPNARQNNGFFPHIGQIFMGKAWNIEEITLRL